MDKILNIFIENPEKEFHVREIARKLKLSPTTVSKKLKQYEKKDLLISEKKLNHLVFKANSESNAYKIEKISLNLNNINNSGIIKYLEKELNYPEVIGLFGSFAKGENAKKSDIDLFVLSPSNNKPDLSKYEKILGHPIHLLIISNNKIEEMKGKNPELLNNLINGTIISGKWRMFR